MDPDDNLLRLTLSRLQPDDLLLILAPDTINSSVLSAVHHAHIQQTPVMALCPAALDLASRQLLAAAAGCSTGAALRHPAGAGPAGGGAVTPAFRLRRLPPPEIWLQ